MLSHPQIDVNWGRVQLDANFEPMPYSALDVASLYGLQETVRLLINHPDLNIEATGPGNFSALHFAAKGGSVEVVKLLLAKFDLNTADIKGRTALDISTKEGHYGVVELLLLLLLEQQESLDNDSKLSNEGNDFNTEGRHQEGDNNDGSPDVIDDSPGGNDHRSQSTGTNIAYPSILITILTLIHVSCHG